MPMGVEAIEPRGQHRKARAPRRSTHDLLAGRALSAGFAATRRVADTAKVACNSFEVSSAGEEPSTELTLSELVAGGRVVLLARPALGAVGEGKENLISCFHTSNGASNLDNLSRSFVTDGRREGRGERAVLDREIGVADTTCDYLHQNFVGLRFVELLTGEMREAEVGERGRREAEQGA